MSSANVERETNLFFGYHEKREFHKRRLFDEECFALCIIILEFVSDGGNNETEYDCRNHQQRLFLINLHFKFSFSCKILKIVSKYKRRILSLSCSIDKKELKLFGNVVLHILNLTGCHKSSI